MSKRESNRMSRILLIDDEDLVVRSIERLLKKMGYDVTSVREGSEAVEKAENDDFDLIITDLRMPRLNGIDTLTQIRQVRRARGNAHIPEICITGYADEELNRRAKTLGVAEYIYKPFDMRDFLQRVKKTIRN